NDAAVITGDDTGSVTEASGVLNGTAGTSPATGDLDASDVDSATDFSVVSNGVHGTLSINAAGEWSYALNEDDAAVQALNVGDPALTDTITVQTSDGTTKDIVITINGANDAAVITGDDTGSVTEASGVLNGTAGTSPATGDLDATDVDSATDFSVVSNGVHGTLSINAAGEWSYALNEDDAAVQALNVGDPALTDTITVQTSDGTTKDIVI
ncbi:VCBS domain-containing protein, partial [Mesorhizobium sp. VK4C]|uniref:VCBS domain-containing protein n=1 Tax=Mesorhizobium captivum TaxID=3072319 RepID=UPI002A244A56